MSCIEVNVVRLLQCRFFILMSSSCSLISEPFYSFSLFVAYCCLLVLVSLSPLMSSFHFFCFDVVCFLVSSNHFTVVFSFVSLISIVFYVLVFRFLHLFFFFLFFFTVRFHFPMPNSEGKLTPPKQQSKPKQILVFVGHKFNNNLSKKKKKIKNKNYWFIVF